MDANISRPIKQRNLRASDSQTLQEAARYFYNLLQDIRAMLTYARDEGIPIDYKLRSEITELLTGMTASEPHPESANFASNNSGMGGRSENE